MNEGGEGTPPVSPTPEAQLEQPKPKLYVSGEADPQEAAKRFGYENPDEVEIITDETAMKQAMFDWLTDKSGKVPPPNIVTTPPPQSR